MKTSTLRNGLLALGIALVSWQPLMAGCGQICTFGIVCDDAPGHPEWGCVQEATYCWEFWCARSANLDKDLAGKIEQAARTGDSTALTQLASAVGQPFRLHSGGKLVYDGFALAGLAGPGAERTSGERLAACGGTTTAPAEAPADKAATAAAADR